MHIKNDCDKAGFNIAFFQAEGEDKDVAALVRSKARISLTYVKVNLIQMARISKKG